MYWLVLLRYPVTSCMSRIKPSIQVRDIGQCQIFVLNQNELFNLCLSILLSSRQDPVEFMSEIRSCKELHMELKTNRSIEDCVL